MQGLCLLLRERAAAADFDPYTPGRCANKPSTRQQTMTQPVIIIVRDSLHLGKIEDDRGVYHYDDHDYDGNGKNKEMTGQSLLLERPTGCLHRAVC